jgi:hypothetical protein
MSAKPLWLMMSAFDCSILKRFIVHSSGDMSGALILAK